MTEHSATFRKKTADASPSGEAISDSRGLSLGSLAESPRHLDPIEERVVPARIDGSVRTLWDCRKFVMRVGVYALLASTIIAFLIPSRYQAVTRLMPPDDVSGTKLGMLSQMLGSRGAGGLGDIASGLLGNKSSGALFLGVLESETVQDRLIDQFHLMKVYRDSKIEDARTDLAKYTDASEDRKSGIIIIGVTDHDPKRAAAMAQAYVQELDRLVAQVSTSSARRERIFLEERLNVVKKELNQAATNFSDFASKNRAIDIPEEGKAMVDAASRLQGGLIAAQSELEGLKQTFADNNVRVRTAQARVDELQKKLNGIAVGSGPGAKGEPPLFPSIRELPVLGVTYAELYRQTKIDETVFELLTEQYELAKVEEAKEIPSVKVLDAAIVPTKKTYPPRAVIIVLGTMFGIALGMTWILGKAQWETVAADDPRKEFAMEIIKETRVDLLRLSSGNANGNSNGHRSWLWWKKTEQPSGMEEENPKQKSE
jgi:capsule polysaccharide export protein KpsE/RkpR